MKRFTWILLSLSTVMGKMSAFQYDFKGDYSLDDYYSSDYDELDYTSTVRNTDRAVRNYTNISSLSEISSDYFTDKNSIQQYLNITNSNISTISPSGFAGFYVITELYLSRNHIKNIQPDAFKNLTNLKQLCLDNNELTELSNGVFNDLHSLLVLYLHNNKIRQIENLVFANLDSLTVLQLQYNQLSEFDDDLYKRLKMFRMLDLAGNPLKTVPQHLSSLKKLILADISLTQFSVNFSESELTSLDLSLNHLSVVDFSLFPKGCHLFLGNNQISLLQNISTFNATYLGLEGNEISTITEPFGNVKNLHLAHNKIKTVEGSPFHQSDELEILFLSFNKISIIRNDTFLGLSSLRHLDLAHNNITKIDVGLFKDLTALRSLNLSHNKIEKFQFGTFANLELLKELDISHNNLVELDLHIFNSLPTLLQFDSNQISSLDLSMLTKHLSHLSRLTHISLNNNPWNCQDLARIEKTLRKHYVFVERGNRFDVENVRGTRCINRNEFKENVNDSKIIKILESLENFKQQPTQMMKAGMVIQILISSSLFVIGILIFLTLQKKLRTNRNTSELLSQIEL